MGFMYCFSLLFILFLIITQSTDPLVESSLLVDASITEHLTKATYRDNNNNIVRIDYHLLLYIIKICENKHFAFINANTCVCSIFVGRQCAVCDLFANSLHLFPHNILMLHCIQLLVLVSSL